MKKLIYSMLALFCVTFTLTSCGGDDTAYDNPGNGAGSMYNPYTVSQAINNISNLTWTSLTEYEKTGDI